MPVVSQYERGFSHYKPVESKRNSNLRLCISGKKCQIIAPLGFLILMLLSGATQWIELI